MTWIAKYTDTSAAKCREELISGRTTIPEYRISGAFVPEIPLKINA